VAFLMPCGRRLVLALGSLALVYALGAGLRTVADADLGWQLAMGRYLVQRHAIPWHDVFSHTVAGREFIYPPFSGALLYLIYELGGYPALSWLGCLASVATTALLLAGGSATGAALAILAVPLIAERTNPRADLFSTLLFAAVLVILWRHFQRRRSPLWLLPVIMCAWANLHLGFIAGLLLIGSYVVMEAAELPWPDRRGAALAGLRAAAPWLAAAILATLANRWGPWLYGTLFRQSRLLEGLGSFVGEWFPLRLSAATARAVLDWRNPDSAYLWLALAGLLAAIAALLQKRPGPALLILGSLFGSFYWVRFQALSAMVTVVTAGDLLTGCRLQAAGHREAKGCGWRAAALAAGMVLLAAFVGVRVADAVSNRAYLRAPGNVVFGPGVSYWYPERAARFIRREHLPPNLFNDYNIGGYLTWALWPEYRTSIDNRAVPFGPELFHLHRRLLSEPPGSPLWREQSERLGLNTLVVGISRYEGSAGFPLRQFCASAEWRPVYLDETAAVFVRDRPENAAWIQRLSIDCGALQFTPPATRDRGRLYHFYMDAGWALFLLGRDREALASLEQARTLFDADPQFYLIKGSMLQAGNRLAEAEAQYRASLRLRESDQAWYAIGQALAAQGRWVEAAEAIGRAARYANFPHEIYRVLGQVYLAMNRPREALDAFERAERSNPYRALADPQAARFRDELAAGRAEAAKRLHQRER
jgi:tetratricopeptide (TPR) repeat protein